MEQKMMRIHYGYVSRLTKETRFEINHLVKKINPDCDDLNFDSLQGEISFSFKDVGLLLKHTKYIAKLMNNNIHFIDDKDIEKDKNGDFSLIVWS
jgi:hypothetical protein